MPSFQCMRVPSTLPNIEEGKRGTQNCFHARPLPPPLRVGELYALGAKKKICKDMLTTCPAAALASSHVHNACADAAPGNALHDPARDVTPVGTPNCKIACTNVHGEWQKARSNPAD